MAAFRRLRGAPAPFQIRPFLLFLLLRSGQTPRSGARFNLITKKPHLTMRRPLYPYRERAASPDAAFEYISGWADAADAAPALSL